MSNTILYPSEQIAQRVEELAQQLAKEYENKQLLLVPILKGSFIFAADLSRELFKHHMDVHIEFLAVSSYGSGTQSSKNPELEHDVTFDIKNKHVLIVDDIFDTGYTQQFVLKKLETHHPASLKSLVLLRKKGREEVAILPDYVGFEIDNVWVEGYGLDTDGLGRGNPNIIIKT